MVASSFPRAPKAFSVVAGVMIRLMQAVQARPASLFCLLSAIFGTFVVLVNPPLRGPDETAHFLRAYGIAEGKVVPSTKDEKGRMGIHLPMELHEQFHYFDTARRYFGADGFSYFDVFSGYFDYRSDRMREDVEPWAQFTPADGAADEGEEREKIFVLYEGSEGYTPAAYIPHIIAVWIAGVSGLDFIEMSYLMRFSGLLVMTAVAAFAIAMTPFLKWSFFLIGLMPVALYGRSVIGADGGTLSYTMLAAALCLSVSVHARRSGVSVLGRSIWMTLSILSKPSQIVFALYEFMRVQRGRLSGQWGTAAVVILPGLILTPFWIYLVSGQMAAWRVVEGTGLPEEQFQPLWKLSFMLQYPFHFPQVFVASLVRDAGELWQQLIGIHGWLDTFMWPWVYPTITLLLLTLCLEKLDIARNVRIRLGIVAFIIAVAYIFCVYLIFFLTWTPVDEAIIWGVQGRYFAVVLPAVAIFIAAIVNRRLPPSIAAAGAIFGATISGLATVDSLLQTNWLARF